MPAWPMWIEMHSLISSASLFHGRAFGSRGGGEERKGSGDGIDRPSERVGLVAGVCEDAEVK
jgi:hypothetical protein